MELGAPVSGAAQRTEVVQEAPDSGTVLLTTIREAARGTPASGALRTDPAQQTLPERQPTGIPPGVQMSLPRRGVLHSRGHMRNPAPPIQMQTGTDIILPPDADLPEGRLAEIYPEELPVLYI